MAQEFDFVNTDAAEIYSTVMEWLMDSVNEPLYPGDERRIYGEALVFVLVNVYHEMNDTAKQRTLQYARGVVLDALGERVGTKRLEPAPAYDTFRFTLSAPSPKTSSFLLVPESHRTAAYILPQKKRLSFRQEKLFGMCWQSVPQQAVTITTWRQGPSKHWWT